MNLSLSGKRALVCGSSQGIGLASAVELASLGATITLFARNEERLTAALERLPASDEQNHDFLIADFDSVQQVEKSVTACLERGHTFQILVNNSGGPPGGDLVEAKENEFIIAFTRHLLANQALVRLLLPGMRSSGYGRIINIISTSVKQPQPGLGVSNTIRGAVAQWSKTLSLELASEGITVNNVLPGATETGRLRGLFEARARATGKPVAFFEEQWKSVIPAGRFGQPEEVAAAVAFLASPSASYINGINIPVDGGRTRGL